MLCMDSEIVICTNCKRKVKLIYGMVPQDRSISQAEQKGNVILLGCEPLSEKDLQKFKESFKCKNCKPDFKRLVDP